MSRFVTIGHICHDLYPGSLYPDDPGTLGGAVTFAAAVAAKFGIPTTAITSAPYNHPRWGDFQELGRSLNFQPVNVNHGLYPNDGSITTFVNEYNVQGDRIQHHPSRNNPFDMRHFPQIAKHLSPEDIVLIGTVTYDEISPELLRAIKGEVNKVGITLQGLLRYVHPDTKRVTGGPFPQWREIASSVDYISLSLEDLQFPDGMSLLADFVRICPLVTLTDGPCGVHIYSNGAHEHIPAFYLNENEILGGAWTGAGDTWTTTFMCARMHGQPSKKAAALAHFYTAMKIRKDPELIISKPDGIPSLPSQIEIEQFRLLNSDRVMEFLHQNNLLADDLQHLFEGHQNAQEESMHLRIET